MAPISPTDIPSFASTQLSLLSAELQAELDETSVLLSQSSPTSLQRAGVALLNLGITSQRTGLGGKTVVELELDPAVGGGDLPEHGIRTGDIVGLQEQPSGGAKKRQKTEIESRGAEGVVTKVGSARVVVALGKEDEEPPGGKLWL
jgi:DNA polymerase alpha-associated DNA helicase A